MMPSVRGIGIALRLSFGLEDNSFHLRLRLRLTTYRSRDSGMWGWACVTSGLIMGHIYNRFFEGI